MTFRLVPLLVTMSTGVITGEALATDYYVDGRNGSDYAAGTATAPFENIFWGLHVAKPGDTVHVLSTITYGPVYIAHSGTAGAPITLAGEWNGTGLTQVVGGGNYAIQLAPGTSYVTVSGFDVQASGSRTAIYVAPGSTHVAIIGNYAHDSGNAGIATVGADYITISGNTVARNGTDGSTACLSGISLYQLRETDGGTDLRNVVQGNIIYGNTNLPGAGCSDSDGNGIIIDDSRNTQNNSPYPAYSAGTLITDNVVFENGGRGIHVFESDHVIVTNNTLWHNNQDPREASWQPGEIMLADSGDAKVMNNVAWSDGRIDGANHHVTISVESCSGGAVLLNNNLLWNNAGSVSLAYYAPTAGSHLSTAPLTIGSWNVWANPQIEVLSSNPEVADYRLRTGSPGFGLANAAATPPYDLLGTAAPKYPTAGAYEKPGP